MSQYLIDTDWIIDVVTGQQPAIDHLNRLAPSGLAVSLITYGELWEGARYSSDPAQSLIDLEALLKGMDLLTLRASTMKIFGDLRGYLRQTGQSIGALDLLIAATALDRGLVLVTRNTRHFQRIPNLSLYSG